MARKLNDRAAAKKARDTKIAIGGFVVLLAVLAFSVPKTMKMMKGPEAEATPAAQAAAPAPAPAPAGTPETPALPEAAAAELADTGGTPAPGQGQLATFERFASKDPFAQQVDPNAAPAPAAPAPPAPAVAETPEPGVDPVDLPSPSPSLPSAPAAPAPTPTPAPEPAPAPKPTGAVISVNGKKETVAVGAAFPAADRIFELRTLGSGEVRISIAGGTLTGGAQTVALKKGKKLTLMNTADGTRYELVLVSIG
jgi:hypothetical protein